MFSYSQNTIAFTSTTNTIRRLYVYFWQSKNINYVRYNLDTNSFVEEAKGRDPPINYLPENLTP